MVHRFSGTAQPGYSRRTWLHSYVQCASGGCACPPNLCDAIVPDSNGLEAPLLLAAAYRLSLPCLQARFIAKNGMASDKWVLQGWMLRRLLTFHVLVFGPTSAPWQRGCVLWWCGVLPFLPGRQGTCTHPASRASRSAVRPCTRRSSRLLCSATLAVLLTHVTPCSSLPPQHATPQRAARAHTSHPRPPCRPLPHAGPSWPPRCWTPARGVPWTCSPPRPACSSTVSRGWVGDGDAAGHQSRCGVDRCESTPVEPPVAPCTALCRTGPHDVICSDVCK